MRIVFTGGGTGGHFYPIIAVAEALKELARAQYLVEPTLYYMAPTPFDPQALFENGIIFLKSPAGKIRRYPSFRNIIDLVFTFTGFLWSFTQLVRLYPDVVISKGGYASVPTVLAAALLRIPIIVHESDAKPGRANLLGARFAVRIATSFDSAAQYFPQKTRIRIARTGVPVRKEFFLPPPADAATLLKLDISVPTILVLGGSQGSARINETILAALPQLVAHANIIHQTGVQHLESTKEVAGITLERDAHAARYHPFGYLSIESLRQAGGIATLVIARAGAGTIAEIAAWKRPAILIPIPEEVSHDQRANAYAFAENGAAVVLEESNLTPHLLASEVTRIVGDTELASTMGAAGASFTDPDAARLLAAAALSIALSHEQGE
ncbi:MAG: hypothetical protein B7X04_00930 [Parcubacteria group bacterium 21-54-25]|nr:MAG: hypothetical protein B7X04_00930 [Parcubacteria group bacterium 21-54-25]HQU07795.1 UDP-N-acetylglucosamine--N-acetylmuramyl-(pentapeptide) pyrophosphoryl-undecaprenol N-acetylglucosamine transferase [Candidatus Paceibacterota bacterium]